MPPAPTAAQALSNYNAAAANTPSASQTYANDAQSLGVPQAQQQVSGLRQAITNTTNLLNNVAPSVMGRTANSLVTAAQANKQISNEQAPISQKLQQENQDFSQANSDLSGLLTQADRQATLDSQDNSNKLTNLKNVYDALFAQEQAKQAQADNAAKLAEQQREFDVGRSNPVLSPSEQKSLYDLQQQQQTVNAVQSLTGELSKVTGSDGYVSPQDYGKAKQAWAAQGFDPTKFDAYFAKFRNPQNKFYPVNSGTQIAALTNAGY